MSYLLRRLPGIIFLNEIYRSLAADDARDDIRSAFCSQHQGVQQRITTINRNRKPSSHPRQAGKALTGERIYATTPKMKSRPYTGRNDV